MFINSIYCYRKQSIVDVAVSTNQSAPCSTLIGQTASDVKAGLSRAHRWYTCFLSGCNVQCLYSHTSSHLGGETATDAHDPLPTRQPRSRLAHLVPGCWEPAGSGDRGHCDGADRNAVPVWSSRLNITRPPDLLRSPIHANETHTKVQTIAKKRIMSQCYLHTKRNNIIVH